MPCPNNIHDSWQLLIPYIQLDSPYSSTPIGFMKPSRVCMSKLVMFPSRCPEATLGINSAANALPADFLQVACYG